jgi:3,4-dihydroxy 2-butanone 4-phosphate synthase
MGHTDHHPRLDAATDDQADVEDALEHATDAATDADSATAVDAAIAAFQRGEPVAIHDAADREGETDLVYPASGVDADAVARMRNDAGGLVCVALPDDVAATYDLPFAEDAIDHALADDHDLAYDDRSSFSLTVNHVDTYTGITDDDRALTITRLADAAASARDGVGDDDDNVDVGDDAGNVDIDDDAGNEDVGDDAGNDDVGDGSGFDFAEEFRAPGHVHLLRAAPDLLAQREGHTELGVALADAADVAPAVVVCEMLDDDTGGATTPTAARAYADREGIPYVEGSALIDRLG